jgi:CubicO group peptidase (beta-lactamase class C family)
MSDRAVQDKVAKDLEEFLVPGVSWAVVEGGEIADVGQLGVAAADRDSAVVARTLFQACSISKPVAAFAMLRLVDRGLLDLDEDVNNRLTSWQIPKTGHWQPVITLRQLVSHSAGLTVHGFPGYPPGAKLPTTRQILDGMFPTNTFGVRIDTIPGTQFRYSGGGTIVLQQLLEDVTGTPFRDLARELVLGPAGMTDSDYAQPLSPEFHDQAATAHDDQGRPIPGRWRSYPELAAAGLWTTPTDLCKFAIEVQRAYAAADGALLSPALAAELLTPQVKASERIGGLDQLGLGLFLGDDGRKFGHSGGNEGFRCHLIAYRDTGQAAAVMTNADNGAWVVQRTLAAIATANNWSDYPLDLDDRVVPIDHDLDNLTGHYRLGDHTTLAIRRQGNGLEVTFAGQHPLHFGLSQKDCYATQFADAQFVLRDEHLYFLQNDKEIPCTRTT